MSIGAEKPLHAWGTLRGVWITPSVITCVLVVLVCGCGKNGNRGSTETPPTGVDESPAPAKPEQAAASESPFDTNGLLRVDRDVDVFVGWLKRNASEDMMRPSEYCLEDGFLWQGAPFRLGRINVIGLPLDLGEVVFRKPIAVFGKKEASLDAALRKIGDCPEGYGREAEMMQMRSDWIADEGGFRTTHDKLKQTEFIRAAGFETIRLHQELGKDDRVTRVRLHNPFTEDIAELEVRFHYEGGPTKPMPTFDDKKLALASGASVDVEVPRTPTGEPLDPTNKRAKRLYGVQLRASVGRAVLDVELPVH
jgi:hypothetical protein